MSLAQMQGVLTPERTSLPQLHHMQRGLQEQGSPSPVLAGAWLAQSSQLWGPAPWAWGGGWESPFPSPGKPLKNVYTPTRM